MYKNLYLIRNIAKSNVIGTKETSIINNLKYRWKNLNDIELVICDNDIRSITSTRKIFYKKNIPFINLNYLHPPPTFTDIDVDLVYSKKDYSKDLYNFKIDLFYDFIRKRKENTICYIGHNYFINELLSYRDHVELERGRPYLSEITIRNNYCDN